MGSQSWPLGGIRFFSKGPRLLWFWAVSAVSRQFWTLLGSRTKISSQTQNLQFRHGIRTCGSQFLVSSLVIKCLVVVVIVKPQSNPDRSSRSARSDPRRHRSTTTWECTKVSLLSEISAIFASVFVRFDPKAIINTKTTVGPYRDPPGPNKSRLC